MVSVSDPVAEAAYWKARALALEQHVEALRSRLLALTRAVPFESVPLVASDADVLSGRAGTADVFAGWEDTTVVRSSDVATELRALWGRLAPHLPASR